MKFIYVVFCCKQKTAYEMRISDWSSDVCSSDLRHLGIVDCRGEHVEPRSVGAPHHGIAHRRWIEMLRAADQVVPFDRGIVIEPETPVRLDALGLEARAIGIAQPQRRAIVDRRQPAPKLDLALERSEEHTSELQSLMRISYAVFCL